MGKNRQRERQDVMPSRSSRADAMSVRRLSRPTAAHKARTARTKLLGRRLRGPAHHDNTQHASGEASNRGPSTQAAGAVAVEHAPAREEFIEEYSPPDR
jgi:hypothetical protein